MACMLSFANVRIATLSWRICPKCRFCVELYRNQGGYGKILHSAQEDHSVKKHPKFHLNWTMPSYKLSWETQSHRRWWVLSATNRILYTVHTARLDLGISYQ